MKAFVTGGSGFIGRHLVRKLLQRGYQVTALARSAESAAALTEMGATAVAGDINDAASMRAGMQGSDIVFHLAAWYKIGADDWMQAERINVEGTRKVLLLAHELSIPKIIYTSSVVVFGDTKGQLVDESYYQAGPFVTEYDRTKWLAHYQVAQPLIEEGVPIIIVMPGVVYGPGDTSALADMMRLFYRGLPLLPGPGTTVTYAHVEDIAEGHILAAEKGKIGESYVLAGPAVPMGEMMDFWMHLTGKRSPVIRVPFPFLRPFASLIRTAGEILQLPAMFSEEMIKTLGTTYMARSDKARRELGWHDRPLQSGMLETFAWIAQTEAEKQPSPVVKQREQLAKVALATAFSLFLAWLIFGRRRD